jgi:hypothetical protein
MRVRLGVLANGIPRHRNEFPAGSPPASRVDKNRPLKNPGLPAGDSSIRVEKISILIRSLTPPSQAGIALAVRIH